MTVKPTPARWMADAEEIPPDRIDPARMLPIGQVAERTGLKVPTILSYVHGSQAVGKRGRMRSLSRPRYNVAGTPYWGVDQVEDYFAVVAQRQSVRREFAHLETISRDEAQRRGLGSLRALARTAQVPLATLFRWARLESFPAPQALLEVNSPSPSVLRSWAEVRTWIYEHRTYWLSSHPEAVPLPERLVDDGQ